METTKDNKITRYEFLASLRSAGALRGLHKLGMMPYKPFFYLDIYEEVDKQLKLGNTRMVAIDITCVKFNIKSYATIYKVINFFNENRGSNTNKKPT